MEDRLTLRGPIPKQQLPYPNAVDLTNWYWIVAGSTTQVYSSAAVAYVPVTDPIYLAWISNSLNKPLSIAVEQDLFDQLSDAGIAIPAIATISDQEKTRLISRADKTIFKLLFNHENRIRVLEGKAAITKAQFISAIKSIM